MGTADEEGKGQHAHAAGRGTEDAMPSFPTATSKVTLLSVCHVTPLSFSYIAVNLLGLFVLFDGNFGGVHVKVVSGQNKSVLIPPVQGVKAMLTKRDQLRRLGKAEVQAQKSETNPDCVFLFVDILSTGPTVSTDCY